CLGSRDVEIYRERQIAEDRLIGRTTTDDEGAWKVRGKVGTGNYLVAVDDSLVAYSPGYGYGEVEEARCSELLMRFRVTPGGRVLTLRILSGEEVLGTRIRAGQLPFTGLPSSTWTILSLGLVAVGTALLVSRWSPTRDLGGPTYRALRD
ncbi:MAG: hypothetical protein ACLGHL_08990, partial [Actinomycetota bacterium]